MTTGAPLLRATRAALEPYRAVLAHAELELELAGRGEVDALAALAARWDAIVAELPQRPPPAAGSLLARATLIHERTRVELERLRASLLSELAANGRARRTAEGYAGHLPRRPRIDRSA